MDFRWESFHNKNEKLKDKGDSILQAILDDDSDTLLELISGLRKGRIIYLPNISKKLPEFLSHHPSLLSVSGFFASKKCFRSLLSHPSNSNAFVEDPQGRTAFHYAAAGGSLGIFKKLDQHFENEKSREGTFDSRNGRQFINDAYNHSDSSGKTAMHYAAQFGRLDIIKYLYRKGADLDLPQYRKYFHPIQLACLYGHVDVVRFFAENGVPLTKEKSMNPIHYACIGGDVATIEYLISQKVDLNDEYHSYTPLFYAAKCGSLNAIKVLLKHKATLKNRGRKNSPIHEAAMNGHLDVVRFFIEQGCDINLYDCTGKSILYLVVEGEYYNFAKYLLSLGATVFPDGRYAKKTKNQSLTKQQTSKSKHRSKRVFPDPISLASSQNEDMLLLLLDHIDINKYIIGHFELKSDDSPEKRKNRIFNSFIKYQSEKLLDILIEQKVFEKDWADLYCHVINAKSEKLAILMFNKQLPFSFTSELITYFVKFKNQSLLNKFLDSGLQLKRKEGEPFLDTNFISSFIEHPSIDLLDILIERAIIGGDCTRLYCQAIDEKSAELAILLLDKKLQFNFTSQLITRLIKFENQCLLPEFLDSGLQLKRKKDDPSLVTNFISSFIEHPSIDLLDILVEHEIIDGDCTDIYSQLLSKCSFAVVESMLDKGLHFRSTTELIFTIIKCNSSSLFQKFINSGLKFTIEDDPFHDINLVSSFIEYPSIDLLDILVEHTIINGDCTDIYLQLLRKRSFAVIESMLDKGLPFRSTIELIFTIIKCDSSPLFQKFINSGLKFNIEDDPLLARNLMSYFLLYPSIELLDILVEHAIIIGDCTDIYFQLLNKHRVAVIESMLDKGLPFLSTTDLIFTIIKCDSSPLFQKFINSGLQFNIEDDPLFVRNLSSYFIENPSIDLLDILVEHTIINGDCTDIYLQLLRKRSFAVIESMLDKGLPFRSTTGLIFTIIKCDSSPLFQKFINSGLQFNIEDDPLFVRNLSSYFIENPSIDLLNIFVEHTIINGDCTDIYLQLLRKRSFAVIESMLDKGLPFQATTELISLVMKCNNSSLLNTFVNSGLPLSPYSIQKIAINAIYSYNVSLIRTLLESKVLLPDEMSISEETEISSLNFNSFKTVSFINVILNAAIMFSPKHMPNYQWGFSLSTSALYQSIDKTDLIEICKLFLNHGFTFSSNDHPICLTSNLTSEQAELLLELLNLIDKSCPNSLDFSKYTIDHIKGLLYNFNNNPAQQLLDFFFLHNFSFKSSEENSKFDDLHLILTILLSNSNCNTWTRSYDDSSGPYKPTRNKSDHEQEQKSRYNCGFINNSFNPDLKLIYYLFDHDYILSSRSLNAIVKYGLKSNNHELIHRAFQHCDLSNEPIITKFGPIYCKTALEIACKNGLVDIAKELIERGANVNEGGYNNHTSPLYYALIANNEELIELLKSKGAISTSEQKQSLQPHFYQYQLQNDFHMKYGRQNK